MNHLLIRIALSFAVLLGGAPHAWTLPSDETDEETNFAGDDGVGGIERTATNGKAWDLIPAGDLNDGLGGEPPPPEPPNGENEATLDDGYWFNLGKAQEGSAGMPLLSGFGTGAADTEFAISLENAPVGSEVLMIFGATVANQPFQGGVLVPSADLILTDGWVQEDGRMAMSFRMPDTMPPDITIVMQAWIVDDQAATGHAASNAVALLTQ